MARESFAQEVSVTANSNRSEPIFLTSLNGGPIATAQALRRVRNGLEHLGEIGRR